MNRGGYRINSGRKSKSAELELFSKLTVYDNLAIDTLIQGVKQGNFHFIKLFMEYRFGKPSQSINSEDTNSYHISIPEPVVYNIAPPLAHSENEVEL
ncbi:MAG: hypothetical protein HQ490_01785 [Lutibacter sp.]|nr:hypothetical protein [Lutibacter sp.]